jgi:hypothetical protein
MHADHGRDKTSRLSLPEIQFGFSINIYSCGQGRLPQR